MPTVPTQYLPWLRWESRPGAACGAQIVRAQNTRRLAHWVACDLPGNFGSPYPSLGRVRVALQLRITVPKAKKPKPKCMPSTRADPCRSARTHTPHSLATPRPRASGDMGGEATPCPHPHGASPSGLARLDIPKPGSPGVRRVVGHPLQLSSQLFAREVAW